MGLVSSDTIEPGGSATVRVQLDPMGKSGPVRKTVRVHTNDPGQPVTRVVLQAKVDHASAADSGKPIGEVLFGRPECAECHADRAKDHMGEDLYRRICEMCHGPLVVYGRALPKEASEPEALRAWIADGKDGSGMPGYARDQGGPLSDEQVDSLVDVILEVRTGKGSNP